jgi:hypothetical protein
MTEAVIDLRYLAESQPSLCIPRVFNNITEHRIRQVFDDLGLGKISRIDIKERKNEKGESFKRVYVHFDKWFWNEDAQAARRKLVSGKEIKIVYDNPWFWKVSASKWAPSGDSQERGPPQRSRAHIDFEEEPRNRVTDEFGRDLSLKKEHDERRRPERRDERRDDSRELRRPERRDERRDDSRERRRPERRDERRPDNRRRDDSRERRRPERNDERRNVKDSRAPIAPTLTRKSERPVTQEKIVPRSPSSSPPRQREDNPDPLTAQHMVKIDYGNIMPPPLRKRKIGGTKKPATELVVKQEPSEDVEEGEVVENTTFPSLSGLTEEDKKICEELYGDLV